MSSIINATEENRTVPQTYIIAQNPAVLARLMMENQQRGINPAAYTTPASVFNTLAVGIDASKSNHSLKTSKLPAAELLKLDPVATSQNLKIKSSTNSISSHVVNPLSTDTSTFETSVIATNVNQMHSKPQVTGVFSENVPLKNNFVICAPAENEFHMNQGYIDSKHLNQTARSSAYNLYGSLERHQPTTDKTLHSKGGSLERHQSLMTAQNMFLYNHGTNIIDRSRNLERQTQLHSYKQQLKTSIECESLPEEIYDFGGVGLKTCVSVKQKNDALLLEAPKRSLKQGEYYYNSPQTSSTNEIHPYTDSSLYVDEEDRLKWHMQPETFPLSHQLDTKNETSEEEMSVPPKAETANKV